MAERRREWREGGRQAEARTQKKLEGQRSGTRARAHTHTHTHTDKCRERKQTCPAIPSPARQNPLPSPPSPSGVPWAQWRHHSYRLQATDRGGALTDGRRPMGELEVA